MNQKTKNRYILFGHGRSGSHLLGDYINQHPDAYFDDELFNFFRLAKLSFWKRWIVKKLPHVYFNRRIRYTQKKVYGFSFIIYQFKIARTSLREMHENGWKMTKGQCSHHQARNNFIADAKTKRRIIDTMRQANASGHGNHITAQQ